MASKTSDSSINIHYRFLQRQLTLAKKQSFIFVLSVALALVTLATLNGFGNNVKQTLARDSKQLFAADIIVSSRFAFPDTLNNLIRTLNEKERIDSARTYEFNSVVRVAGTEKSLLVDIKAVSDKYPFYGDIQLASEQELENVLMPGTAIADTVLLERLGIKVEQSLIVGNKQLVITDAILKEPDRGVQFFNLGPRLMLSTEDLDELGLISNRSRVSHKWLIKINNSNVNSDTNTELNAIVKQLKSATSDDAINVETYLTAESSIQRFIESLLFFLSLIGIFTLLLAGIGIQTSLTAYLKEQEQTIAIIKTIGASRQFVQRHYLLLVAILGTLGLALGLAISFIIQWVLSQLLAELLSNSISVGISFNSLLESLLLGVTIVSVFSYIPLQRLQALRPSFIFRKALFEQPKTIGYYLSIAIILFVFMFAVLWNIGDVRIGFGFIVISLVLLGVSTLLTTLMLKTFIFIKLLPSLALRQAITGLFRPMNATTSIVITLSASLCIIFTIFLLERNLTTNYIKAYPDDTDNVVILDIQSNQLDDFKLFVQNIEIKENIALSKDMNYYPVVRASINAINGKLLDRESEKQQQRDNLARSFSITYRDSLAENEVLTMGDELFNKQWTEQGVTSVSVLDYIIKDRDIGIGDIISFRIQGVPIDARISSIRSRVEENLEPFFVFVFQSEILQSAPQTIFTSMRIDNDRLIPQLQNQIVTQFPNISVINITESIKQLSIVLKKLTQIIIFFSLFSILAGVLIVVSSIYATREARIQESVYYKILGATKGFVSRIFLIENMILGLLSGLLGLSMAQVLSWLISRYALDMNYHIYWVDSLLLIVITLGVIIAIGMISARGILKSKPVHYLTRVI